MTTQTRTMTSPDATAMGMDNFAAPPSAPLDMPQQVLETRTQGFFIFNMIRLLVPRQWA
ncbi:hypothetical protein [Donghicola sp. XS_ASV15]|uniref:hypothetical protein n=1 Tax=Donghicola sp. XS_ASV15 TaxID=3241295 RepID=UPI00351832F5